MRVFSLVGSLFLGLSLTSFALAAPAATGAAGAHASSAQVSVKKVSSKPAKSKTKSRAQRPAKARQALAHKALPAAAASAPVVATELADRSLDGHSGLSQERVYEGLLPTEGVEVAYPSFANSAGRTECVELIKGLLDAPSTRQWQEGRKLKPHAKDIQPGTAIATFVNGRYPQTRRRGNKHAAIFLRATEQGIYVLDQFVHQQRAQERFIPWHNPRDRRAANNASTYSTVRW